MFCLCIFSSTFSIDGRSRSSRAYVGGLGPLLGPMLAVLGRSWGLYGRSGAEKCKEHGDLENVLISRAGARSAAWRSVLRPMLAVLGRSWALCWRSWAALGAYVGGLGSRSGPKLAVLGGLGAEVVGLGSDQGEKWPKPEREHDPQRVGPPEASEASHPFLSMIYIHTRIFVTN